MMNAETYSEGGLREEKDQGGRVGREKMEG